MSASILHTNIFQFTCRCLIFLWRSLFRFPDANTAENTVSILTDSGRNLKCLTNDGVNIAISCRIWCDFWYIRQNRFCSWRNEIFSHATSTASFLDVFKITPIPVGIYNIREISTDIGSTTHQCFLLWRYSCCTQLLPTESVKTEVVVMFRAQNIFQLHRSYSIQWMLLLLVLLLFSRKNKIRNKLKYDRHKVVSPHNLFWVGSRAKTSENIF